MIEKFKCLISNLDVKICKYSDRGCQNTDTTFIDEHPRGGGGGLNEKWGERREWRLRWVGLAQSRKIYFLFTTQILEDFIKRIIYEIKCLQNTNMYVCT